MYSWGNFRLLRITDARIAVVIGLVAAVGGWWNQHSPTYGLINVVANDFEPAVLWASGHGFSRATVRPPALDDFLMNRTYHLNPNDLPKFMPVESVAGEMFVNDRIYLLYAVGIMWRLFGIYWAWLPVFIGMTLGLLAVLVYAIFRLGMGRAVSVAGTLLTISSPLMVAMLPALRDVSKGPFILATILAAGYLLSHPIRIGPLLVLSLFLGIMIGVGVGFRQDCAICLPPALFALVFLAHRKEGPIGLGMRALGVALFLGAFVISASPVLLMNLRTGGNNGLYMLQGHAIYCQETMGMRRACYAPVVQSDDAFVQANLCVYNARSSHGNTEVAAKGADCFSAKAAHLLNPIANALAPPNNFKSGVFGDKLRIEHLREWQARLFWQGVASMFYAPMEGVSQLAGAVVFESLTSSLSSGGVTDYEQAARRLLIHLGTTFPADVISRCYAATTHVVHGMRGYAATRQTVNPGVGTRGNPDNRNEPKPTWHSLHLFMERHLEKYGEYYALAALIIISTRSVWMALVALGLIMYFCGYAGLFFQDRHAFHLEFVAFWLPAFCVERALSLVREIASKEKRRTIFFTGGCLHRKSVPVKRAVVFLAVAFLTLSLPLGVARLWQRAKVDDILRTYRTCQLEPIPFEERTDPDGGTHYWTTNIPALRERVPVPWPLRLSGLYTDPLDGLLYNYLVAEFETPQPCPRLTMRVLYDLCSYDTICDLRDDYDEGSGKGPFTVRYFFPVYQFTRHHQLSPFKGFSLTPWIPLKNLYRVKNQEDFLLPMNLWLFEEPGNSRCYQAVPFFGTWI